MFHSWVALEWERAAEADPKGVGHVPWEGLSQREAAELGFNAAMKVARLDAMREMEQDRHAMWLARVAAEERDREARAANQEAHSEQPVEIVRSPLAGDRRRWGGVFSRLGKLRDEAARRAGNRATMDWSPSEPKPREEGRE